VSFNRFGATAAQLPPLYPGTINTDFGGDTAIEGAIDRAVDLILGSLSPRVYQTLIEPDLVRLVQRATAGQTALPAVPLLPMVADSIHVWTGFPTEFQVRPRKLYDPQGDGLVDLPADRFSAVLATGVITLTQPLQADMQVYVSYRTNPNSASFVLPSLARLAIRGAAAELGARLYTQGTQEWLLVDEYRTQFIDELARLRNGDSVPDEIRLAVFWQEIDRVSNQVSSVQMRRG
jgi:hypothetical protein